MISAISGYVIDVCLFVCQQAYLVKLGGEVEHGPKKKQLQSGAVPWSWLGLCSLSALLVVWCFCSASSVFCVGNTCWGAMSWLMTCGFESRWGWCVCVCVRTFNWGNPVLQVSDGQTSGHPNLCVNFQVRYHGGIISSVCTCCCLKRQAHQHQLLQNNRKKSMWLG